MLKSLYQIANFIAPAECLGCGHEGSWACDVCLRSKLQVKRPTCFNCNALVAGGRTCGRCRRNSALTGVVVASHYDGLAKELITKFKFDSTPDIARLLVNVLADKISGSDFDVVIPLPTAAGRYRQRGFDQASLLAKELASNLRLPYSRSLVRLGYARQLGHSRRDRLQQLAGSFEATKNVDRQRVLLVDDVMTTGASLNEAAKVLQSKGARSVWGAVVAKH